MNNNIISLTEEKNELLVKYNNITIENKSLLSNIDSLQDNLNNTLQELEDLNTKYSQNDYNSSISNTITEEPNITYKNDLLDIYVIDSNFYSIIKGFSDSYGNSYSLAYKFDASRNAYAKFNLDQKYHVLAGYVTASPDTGRDTNMTIEIYGDDILLKKFENITKETEAIPLKDIDIKNVKKLTISTYNTGAYGYGYLYIADAKLN